MPSQRDPAPTTATQASLSRGSVGQFLEKFRAEVIPLSTTIGYFCASVPMSEEVLKEYLEEPVAALPSAIAAMLPRISILLVPYLERSGERKAAKAAAARTKRAPEKMSDFVVGERPAEGRQS